MSVTWYIIQPLVRLLLHITNPQLVWYHLHRFLLHNDPIQFLLGMFSLQSEYISPYSVSTHFPILLWHFLHVQTHPDADIAADVHINDYQSIHSHIYVYHSAVAWFYTPSDLCGTSGMYHEHIHSNPNWCGEFPWYDTVFVETDSELNGMAGLTLGHLLLLLSMSKPRCYLGFVAQTQYSGKRDKQKVRHKYALLE